MRLHIIVPGLAAQAAVVTKFESVVEQQSTKLTGAERYAVALIGNQPNTVAAQLIATNPMLESKVRRLLLLLVGFAFLAGAVGGLIGAMSAGA